MLLACALVLPWLVLGVWHKNWRTVNQSYLQHYSRVKEVHRAQQRPLVKAVEQNAGASPQQWLLHFFTRVADVFGGVCRLTRVSWKNGVVLVSGEVRFLSDLRALLLRWRQVEPTIPVALQSVHVGTRNTVALRFG